MDLTGYLKQKLWFKQILFTCIGSGILYIIVSFLFSYPLILIPTIPYLATGIFCLWLYNNKKEALSFYLINIGFFVLLPIFSIFINLDITISLSYIVILVNLVLVLKKKTYLNEMCIALFVSFMLFYFLSGFRDQVILNLRWLDFLLAGFVLANCLNTMLQIKKERLRIIKSLDEKNSELEKYIHSNIKLEQFAHLAAHDIKAPAVTLKSFAQLLIEKKDEISESEREKIHGILNDYASQISSLVTDLSDYAKVNAALPVFKKVNTEEIWMEVKALYRSQINHYDIKINKNDTFPVLVGDRKKLKRVFIHLIDNAIKFSKEKGEIEISLAYEEKAEGYYFQICDKGVGMKLNRKDIFEPGKKLNLNSEYEGSGLGLSFFKTIVEQHKGNYGYESTPGEGTCVYFTISKRLVEN